MAEVSMIGLDLAKNTFQAHGANADGSVAFRKKLRRDKVMAFFAGQPRCTVAMEAYAGAHFWARSLQELGYEVRLVPPVYVKPFVKRQKNDAADAEAIAEAASRPTMRFVAVESEAKQGKRCGSPRSLGRVRRPFSPGVKAGRGGSRWPKGAASGVSSGASTCVLGGRVASAARITATSMG